jgi:outer membrane lipoprotein carrier protein
MSRIGVIVAAVLAVWVPAGQAARPQARPSAADLARRIQAHYTGVRDFRANFTLAQSTTLSTRVATDRGRVVVQKPGKMHWTFLTGNKSEVVSDGVQIYSYFPQDKLVQVTGYPEPGAGSMALLFLAGRGDLVRDFDAALPADAPAGEWRLRLTPRTPQADFVSLTLDVDPRTLAWRGFVIVDDQGGTRTFGFSDLVENASVSPHEFEFHVPKGVEIRR